MKIGTERVPTFTPPRVDLGDVLQKAKGTNQLIDPGKLTQELLRVFGDVQNANGEWVEGKFQTLRTIPGAWSLDGMLVDTEGRIRIGPWSTYQMYLKNEVPDLSLPSIFAEMQKRDRLLIPLIPLRNSTIFWLEEKPDQVPASIQEHLPDDPLEVTHYTDFSSTDFGFRRIADLRKVNMARIRSGKAGDGKFAQRGIVRGRLGFWENTTPEGLSYSPRVFIDKSIIFPKQTYISSKPETVVLLTGGKPMNENHPNVQVLRTDPNLTGQSFIVAALIAFSRAYEGIPFILQYDTYRPWAGHFPHHD